MTEEAVKAFLEELSALTRKHRIEIGGCGCCGSPFLKEVNVSRVDGCLYQVNGYAYATAGVEPWWTWDYLAWVPDDGGNG